MKVYIASNNSHKALEIDALLRNSGIEVDVRSASEVGGMPEVAETENSFEGNALLKARALGEMVSAGCWVLADDSGLHVEALDGAPGVRSKRYAGIKATDEDNVVKLLKMLTHTPPEARSARFVCSLVLLRDRTVVERFKGECEGRISDAPRGVQGFGYDPVFVPKGYQRTFAELGLDVKNKISHRARALNELALWFQRSMPLLGS